MKKIAMLTCLNVTSKTCTGSGCFAAVNNKTGSFAQYEQEDIQTLAFFQCNGCDNPLDADENLQKKVARIITLAPDAIHVGVCAKNKQSGEYCSIIKQMLAEFQQHDITIVLGTH